MALTATVIQFAGGITNYGEINDSMGAISKYLISLCGKYGAAAEKRLSPNISLSSDSYNFGSVNGVSNTTTFDLICSNLTGNQVSITSLDSNFQISRDGIHWGSGETYFNSTHVFPIKLYVRFVPLSIGSKKGEIHILNGDLVKIIYLSGIGI
jgi:hypothetical protein